jgi:hypothetical protein
MTIAAERLAVIAAITLPITSLSSVVGINVIVNDFTKWIPRKQGGGDQSRIVISPEVTTADGPTPSTVKMAFQVPGKGKR